MAGMAGSSGSSHSLISVHSVLCLVQYVVSFAYQASSHHPVVDCLPRTAMVLFLNKLELCMLCFFCFFLNGTHARFHTQQSLEFTQNYTEKTKARAE